VSFYAPRLKLFDYLGEYRYSLTLCTFNRERYFEDANTVRVTLAQIERSAQLEGFDVPAYCFMPDHLHLLVFGNSAESRLPRFIKTSKQLSGFVYRQRTGQTLWQRSGWDRVLRGEEATSDVARYILANPVRAGLVTIAEHYEFSGSLTCSREELFESLRRART
jgi:putative transposase